MNDILQFFFIYKKQPQIITQQQLQQQQQQLTLPPRSQPQQTLQVSRKCFFNAENIFRI